MQFPTEQPGDTQEGFYHPAQTAQYQAGQTDEIAPSETPFDDSEVVSWQASEYIHHNKNFGWIAGFTALVLVGLSISIFFTQWLLVVLIAVMAVALGISAFRQPKVKQYTLTHQGLKIDDHMYHLNDFRSFSILAEDAFYSIMLMPIKRFMPAIIVYFAQNDGEKIVDILGSHLPLEDLEPDPIDTLMRRLHF